MYLDDGVGQVYRTQRVSMIVADQEVVGSESILQLEPIAVLSATSTGGTFDAHNDFDLLVIDVDI
jgi:hypothetical protein